MPNPAKISLDYSLVGNFPVEILPLDCNAEAAIVGGLVRELNDCYCLNLHTNPALCRGNGPEWFTTG